MIVAANIIQKSNAFGKIIPEGFSGAAELI
jgi:hypothetical protein